MAMQEIFDQCAAHAAKVREAQSAEQEEQRKVEAAKNSTKLIAHYGKVFDSLPDELLQHIDFSGDRGFDYFYGELPMVVPVFYHFSDVRVKIHSEYNSSKIYYRACVASKVSDRGEVVYIDSPEHRDQDDWQIAFADAYTLRRHNVRVRDAGYVGETGNRSEDPVDPIVDALDAIVKVLSSIDTRMAYMGVGYGS